MYGKKNADVSGTAAVRLIDGTLSPGTATYTFIKSPGSFVSFSDFDSFEVYDVTNQAFVGLGVLPLPLAGATVQTTLSQTTGAPTPTRVNSSTIKLCLGVLAIIAHLLVTLL